MASKYVRSKDPFEAAEWDGVLGLAQARHGGTRSRNNDKLMPTLQSSRDCFCALHPASP